ncbi:unnamed protein product [Rotaria sp. Silwood2]|nr:unnamed protein product [Rotaria sp. Silwood2]CAF2752473.1 unnamed protein product [Rotaria sp. Silwood2]CAF2911700.1 unnamed protein product [Rotaria sp. Silwood2]CAF3204461.1 unnamed protein product [Rotaria sp. Silwood2]CAF3907476.1 unnamed protein product [Rotaria sp. Silwood2]
MSNLNNAPVPKKSQNLNDFESAEHTESKFWRKIKEDPVVPVGEFKFLSVYILINIKFPFFLKGMAGFGLIVLGAIIGYNRRDRNKPTSTYWIRTRVYAQGFVVSLLTAAAIYQAVKTTSEPHNIHGHNRGHHTHNNHGHGKLHHEESTSNNQHSK